jgi:tetratricopeptide (TPR) repeat protein
VASFTEAIGLDPENIPAYMGRAEAYVGLKQYDDAKADYTTAIEKTEEQPYTQAEAYVGRAEVNELTTSNEDALSDYEAASTALDKVDVEKITDVTEQMLEALKIKVYNACARLNAFFGRNEAAAASYTKAIDSLAKLPDDAEVLDVKAAKIESYTGRADANAAQEKYEEVLPDYDALIDMGEDKTADRDAILRAMSLAKSKAGDLNSSNNWLGEVNHADYAVSIQLTEAENILKQAAEQAKADGVKAYDKIKETLSTDEAKAAMQNLLARGYQLRYYDADGKMLAVYADATAWADVNEEENGMITAEALTAADPSAEDISAVSLGKLYVYYGGHENRSREGEGRWFILNPAKTDLTAETYTWENDKPKGDFKKKEVPKPVAADVQMTSYSASQTLDSAGYPGWSSQATVTYGIGGTTLRVRETFFNNGVVDIDWDTKLIFSQPILEVSRKSYGAAFTVPAGTTVKRADGYGVETFSGESGKALTIKAGKTYHLNYAGMESYGITITAK